MAGYYAVLAVLLLNFHIVNRFSFVYLPIYDISINHASPTCNMDQIKDFKSLILTLKAPITTAADYKF